MMLPKWWKFAQISFSFSNDRLVGSDHFLCNGQNHLLWVGWFVCVYVCSFKLIFSSSWYFLCLFICGCCCGFSFVLLLTQRNVFYCDFKMDFTEEEKNICFYICVCVCMVFICDTLLFVWVCLAVSLFAFACDLLWGAVYKCVYLHVCLCVCLCEFIPFYHQM